MVYTPFNGHTPYCKTRAFEQAYNSLSRLGFPKCLSDLHSAGLTIKRFVLGGSHSVAIYPPIDSFSLLSGGHVLDELSFGRDTSLYVHIPFCETRCTFCHYSVEHYSGSSDPSETRKSMVLQYVKALKQELAFWSFRLCQTSTSVSSIYIGGGTPLLLEKPCLQEIIGAIIDGFDILPGAEICIEGSPLSITADDGEDKLHFLRKAGFTRLSFGVQSFDDTVLKHAGRGYNREVPIRAAEITKKIFSNWNLDLIQGLYNGSPEETWENLQVVSNLRPAHLTWYHARFADRPQGEWYRSEKRRRCFEDEQETLLGRMLIWQELKEYGYQQTDGNRFALSSHYIDPFKQVRTSSSCDLLGIGAAAYSHVGTHSLTPNQWGYAYRNDSNISKYIQTVLSGGSPIVSGRVIDNEELLAMSYVTGLRKGRIETAKLMAIKRANANLSADYEQLTERLLHLGVLERFNVSADVRGLRLTELGRLFEDEVLSMFFSPTVKQKLTDS
jgi:oxygen-independent coproporphyrinogen-3 oxidase